MRTKKLLVRLNWRYATGYTSAARQRIQPEGFILASICDIAMSLDNVLIA